MKKKLFKIIAFFICFSMLFEQSGFAQVAGQLDLSGYIGGLRSSFVQDKFRPLHLRYLAHDNQSNNFKLLLDKGDLKKKNRSELKGATEQLLDYFLVGVSLPNESFWVNLRPDSADNIIDPYLANTDVGKVLLEADLQLKKDTAKATSPETTEGRRYWKELYKKAEELFGYENITIPTLSRPWIVPSEIIIRETQDSAYVYKATLKVMLEQDHLKDSPTYNFKDPRMRALNEYAAGLMRKHIIPKLTKEVNIAKRYAGLRQVYYSLILAQWFKARFRGKAGLYSRLINRRDLSGLTSREPWTKTFYFQQYQQSFKDGEYNIQEPVRTPFGQTIRTYFSGGIELMASIPQTPPFPGTMQSDDPVLVIGGNPANNLPRLPSGEELIAIEGTQQDRSLQVVSSNEGGIAAGAGGSASALSQADRPAALQEAAAAGQVSGEEHADLGGQVANAKHLERLKRILGVFARAVENRDEMPRALQLPEGAALQDRDAVEFALQHLRGLDPGLVTEELIAVEGAGQVRVIRINDNAAKRLQGDGLRILKVIQEHALNRRDGVRAINFKGRDNRWVIVGFRSGLTRQVLKHEQKEIEYRAQGMPWAEAHNRAVNNLGGIWVRGAQRIVEFFRILQCQMRLDGALNKIITAAVRDEGVTDEQLKRAGGMSVLIRSSAESRISILLKLSVVFAGHNFIKLLNDEELLMAVAHEIAHALLGHGGGEEKDADILGQRLFLRAKHRGLAGEKEKEEAADIFEKLIQKAKQVPEAKLAGLLRSQSGHPANNERVDALRAEKPAATLTSISELILFKNKSIAGDIRSVRDVLRRPLIGRIGMFFRVLVRQFRKALWAEKDWNRIKHAVDLEVSPNDAELGAQLGEDKMPPAAADISPDSLPTDRALAQEGLRALQGLIDSLPENLASRVRNYITSLMWVYTGIHPELGVLSEYLMRGISQAERERLIAAIERDGRFIVVGYSRDWADQQAYSLINLEAARRVMLASPDYFPAEALENPAQWLKGNLDKWAVSIHAAQPIVQIRYGLLSGFPRSAVEKFAALGAVMSLTQIRSGIRHRFASSEEFDRYKNWLDSGEPASGEEKIELRGILRRVRENLSPEEKQKYDLSDEKIDLLLESRLVRNSVFPGFVGFGEGEETWADQLEAIFNDAAASARSSGEIAFLAQPPAAGTDTSLDDSHGPSTLTLPSTQARFGHLPPLLRGWVAAVAEAFEAAIGLWSFVPAHGTEQAQAQRTQRSRGHRAIKIASAAAIILSIPILGYATALGFIPALGIGLGTALIANIIAHGIYNTLAQKMGWARLEVPGQSMEGQLPAAAGRGIEVAIKYLVNYDTPSPGLKSDEPTAEEREELLRKMQGVVRHIADVQPAIIARWLINVGFAVSAEEIKKIDIAYHRSGSNKRVFRVQVQSSRGNKEFLLALKTNRQAQLFEPGELDMLTRLQGTGFVPQLGGVIYIEDIGQGYGEILFEEPQDISGFETLEAEEFIEGFTLEEIAASTEQALNLPEARNIVLGGVASGEEINTIRQRLTEYLLRKSFTPEAAAAAFEGLNILIGMGGDLSVILKNKPFQQITSIICARASSLMAQAFFALNGEGELTGDFPLDVHWRNIMLESGSGRLVIVDLGKRKTGSGFIAFIVEALIYYSNMPNLSPENAIDSILEVVPPQQRPEVLRRLEQLRDHKVVRGLVGGLFPSDTEVGWLYGVSNRVSEFVKKYLKSCERKLKMSGFLQIKNVSILRLRALLS